MAQAENKDLPEEEKSSLEETALMNKMWGLVMIAQKSSPRMKGSSARQSRGPIRWFISIPKIQLEQTGIAKTSDKEESRNILEESCCLRIKCTTTNFLATLMWR